ncbi:hypothetical protein VTL71DRAFT_9725 [Oculimacula yallundae]|uniref:Zn(2)-C6 fungal-type domain-containing protein n=1 Tax=Oculimacula yallundae TaxID=86028 RepID=A0ABR4BRU4_9HELO
MMSDPSSVRESNQASMAEPPQLAPYKPRIRRNFSRSKLGCFTCKTRRKKCDERHPICVNCQRNKFQCTWPEGSFPSDVRNHLKAIGQPSINEDAAPSPKSSVRNTEKATSSVEIVPSEEAILSIIKSAAGLEPLPIPISLSCIPGSLSKPSSRMLFDRYMSQTSKDLGATTKPSNPFIAYVIPLALSDELYMNCVLALSGSDLGCEASIHPSTKSATWSHYSHADIQQALHLLFLTLGLMHVELLSGAATHLIFPHLIASRHLIYNILSAPSLLTERNHVSLFGHLFELYSIRVLGGSVHRPEQTKSSVPYGILKLDFFLGSFVSTPQYPFYLTTFESSGHMLATFAPRIASFTAVQESRSEIPLTTPTSDTDDETLCEAYETLSTRLREWRPPQLDQDDGVSPARATAFMIYQNALLIYLQSIFLPTAAALQSTALYSTITSEIQMRIEICVPLLSALFPSRMEGLILWPSTIFGSCLRKPHDIKMLSGGMSRARYKLRSVRWVGQVLERLWSQTSEARLGCPENDRLWGPRGLAAVIENELG